METFRGLSGMAWRFHTGTWLAVIGLAVLPAGAAEKYVTPDGGGAFNGSDWANAYSSVQQAVDASPNAGDIIFLKYGTYVNTAQIDVNGHPGLTIRGGYQGDGTPGPFTNETTVLTRSLASTNRIFGCAESTVLFDRLIVSNGLDLVGGGFCLTNCAVTIADCQIVSNKLLSGTLYGGGLYATGGTVTVRNTRIAGNGGKCQSGKNGYGGGIYTLASMVTLTNTTFEWNAITEGARSCGGGAALSGGSAWIVDCVFATNQVVNVGADGGGLHANGVSPLTVERSRFVGNRAMPSSYNSYGGAIYVNGGSGLLVSNCAFSGNYALQNTQQSQGNMVYMTTPGGCGRLVDCVMEAGPGVGPEEIYVNVATTNSIAIVNTVLTGGSSGNGIWKTGSGTLALTNCLIRYHAKNGIAADKGIVIVANSTLAHNRGWGLTNAAATVTNMVIDSIVWGNASGGVATNIRSIVNHTCSQELLDGDGNLSADPRFIVGAYLSVAGLPYQTVNSPCIDAGSTTAAALGLDGRTTRTDGGADTAGNVDLGYHAAAGAPGNVSNLFLFVDGTSGNDGNTGWSANTSVKSISRALSLALDGSVISIESAVYSEAATGESFPLVANACDLTLKGANRAATLVDAGGASRVLQVEAKGRLRLEALTLTNGYADAGAGLNLIGIETTLTNCTLTRNQTYVTGGGGINAFGGTLKMTDVRFIGNVGKMVQGGGLCAVAVAVEMSDVLFENNVIGPNASVSKGAGVYLSGGSASVLDCDFHTNSMANYGQYGTALFAHNVEPLTISRCRFIGNYSTCNSYSSYGGVVSLTGDRPFRMTDCRFIGNNMSGYPGAGGVIFVGGPNYGTPSGIRGIIKNCAIEAHPTKGISAEDIRIATTSTVSIMNLVLVGGKNLNGIAKDGSGWLDLTNCLIRSYANNGITAVAGTIRLANCTIASNGWWGVSNVAGTVEAINCIAWTNGVGGFSPNCSLTYTCSQEPHDGAGNKVADPLFANASTNNYHLTRWSPCVNAGLNGLWTKADTDLDGNPRLSGGVVDMGPYELQLVSGGTLLLVR